MKKIIIFFIILVSINGNSQTVQNWVSRGINTKWYNLAWNYRTRIDIKSFKQNRPLVSFQYKIDLNSTNFNFSHAKSDGSDLIFTANDKITALNFYIQNYNSVSKTATIWVVVPNIPIKGNISIYCYYGNSSASSLSNYDNCFSKLTTNANTLGLWHFDEGSGTTSADATSTYTANLYGTPTWGANDGGSFGDNSSTVSFSSGSYISLNGTSQYIKIPTILNTFPTSGTIEMWFNITTLNRANYFFYKNNTAGNYNNLVECHLDASNRINLYWSGQGQGASSPAITYSWTANKWYLLTVTWGNKLSLYINGQLLYETIPTKYLDNGSADIFTVGAATWGGTTNNFAALKFDELLISNVESTMADIQARFWRKKALPTERDKWQRYSNTPILTGTQAWEKGSNLYYSIFEPEVRLNSDQSDPNKKWVMIYTGGWSKPALGLAYSPDKLNWTKYSNNPVLGQADVYSGHGSGITGTACRSYIIYKDGFWYCYFANGNPTADLCRAKSTDLINWTLDGNDANGVVIAHNARTWFRGLANSGVWIDGNGLWNLYVDIYGAVGDPQWTSTYWTSTDGKSWTPVPDALPTLSNMKSLWPSLPNGIFGSLTPPLYMNSKYYTWYLGGVGTVPTNLYRASSTNVNGPWTILNNNPVLLLSDEINISAIAPLDQLGDPDILEDNGQSYIYYDGDNNADASNGKADIRLSIFNGLFSELVDDTSYYYIINSEQSK